MYMDLSESQVFNTLRRTWPVFDDFKSFNQLLCEGWVNNAFFNKNIPYIWRSNKRISEERFWNVFAKVFSSIDEPDGFILFHEKHAGWRKKRGRRIRNGVSLHRLLDVPIFVRGFAFYSRRQWQYGEMNDNYNLLLTHSRSFISFTHEGEFLCFSTDKSKLIEIARSFHSFHLACKFES